MYRWDRDEILVLLVHPGGPFWSRRDLGSWSIPKGEYAPDENPEQAALREFTEELGLKPEGQLRPLGEIVQSGGKRVTAFALEGDLDTTLVQSNRFVLEWPPRSGQMRSFPEVDRAAWFPLALARQKLLPSQLPLLDRLVETLGSRPRD